MTEKPNAKRNAGPFSGQFTPAWMELTAEQKRVRILREKWEFVRRTQEAELWRWALEFPKVLPDPYRTKEKDTPHLVRSHFFTKLRTGKLLE